MRSCSMSTALCIKRDSGRPPDKQNFRLLPYRVWPEPKISGSWISLWVTMPEVSWSCRELIKVPGKGRANEDCSPLCSANAFHKLFLIGRQPKGLKALQYIKLFSMKLMFCPWQLPWLAATRLDGLARFPVLPRLVVTCMILPRIHLRMKDTFKILFILLWKLYTTKLI